MNYGYLPSYRFVSSRSHNCPAEVHTLGWIGEWLRHSAGAGTRHGLITIPYQGTLVPGYGTVSILRYSTVRYKYSTVQYVCVIAAVPMCDCGGHGDWASAHSPRSSTETV